ncbi:unnamed protein product [Rotaria sordida]|uniref:Uncharacterized protein n=1 Tax=Rotaria sordida TaxID=392033 RepID=A0A819LHL2_9BILA|nr:unnamed protein product [Rotaria sordida]
MALAYSSVTSSIDEINKNFQDINLDSHLFLSDDPFHLKSSEGTYIIFSPPTNISGDIYHTLTYLMLAKHEKKQLPLIQLSYDGKETLEETESQMNTYSQVKRCLRCAEHLGFKDSFLPPINFGEDNKYRPNARYAKVVGYLKKHHNKNENIYYCEQKLLTTLISNYFLTSGRDKTTKILNKSYGKWSVNEKVNNKIKKKVQQVIQTIKMKTSSKPLIIIQYRYSSKANDNQNIDEIEIFNRFIKYLNQKNYATWYLFVDSRAKKSKGISNIDNKTNCFPYEIENHDYGKLFHLEFLLQILKLKNVKGIIGNTSGCLDLAAFVGHNVLNLHQSNEMNYQSYRMFLQSSFLIVEDFNENVIENILKDKKKHWIDFTDEIMNEYMPIAADWIKNKKNTPTFPKQKFANFDDDKINNAGFVDLHQILTWKDDTLYATSIPIFKHVRKKLLKYN